MAAYELSIPFTARGVDGVVEVSVETGVEPSVIGCPETQRHFPACEARIASAARGYAAVMGWVQLVDMRSPAGVDVANWVTDPLQVYEGLNTPFGFHGVLPTLFDAPSRSDRSRSLDWRAESFLCIAPSSPMVREAQPVAAFSWGFLMEGGGVVAEPPRPLPLTAWEAHLPLLTSSYPGWEFSRA